MRLRSDQLAHGCYANMTYRIGEDQASTLRVQFDNPWLGKNGYHTDTDRLHYSTWTAVGSTDSTVDFTLQPRGEVTTGFVPSRDGFKFGNDWPETPYALPFLRDTVFAQKYGDAGMGLCGGMAFAALDYFLTDQMIPTQTDRPPGEQDPLFMYLVDRLFDSFDPPTVTLMLSLLPAAYPDSDENVLSRLGLASGRAAVMAHQEWPLIKRDIDNGIPSPIFVQTVKPLLPNPADLGDCHQVLVYAYNVSNHDILLRIYDPNSPIVDGVTLSFSDATAAEPIIVTHNIDVADAGVPREIYCFVRMNYEVTQPTVSTSPRPSAPARADRRLGLRESAPSRTVGKTRVRGAQSFEILPDCGAADFPFTIVEETNVLTLTALPIGFVEPVVEWTVGDTVVGDGSSKGVSVRNVQTWQVSGPVVEEAEDKVTTWGEAKVRDVLISATVSGGALTVVNRAEDGNYTLELSVTCRESVEVEPGAGRRYFVEVTGWRADVHGFSEATGACLKQYVDARRNGQPDEQALLDQLLGQLGRPDNPLWDPDPQLAEVTALVSAADPRRAEAAADVAGLHELTALRLEELLALKDIVVQRPPVDRPPVERPPIERPPFVIQIDRPL